MRNHQVRIKKNHEDNKEKLAEWFKTNKEQLAEKRKEYYNKNKEKLQQICNCSCGKTYTYQNKSNHLRSKFHMNFLNDGDTFAGLNIDDSDAVQQGVNIDIHRVCGRCSVL